MPGGSKFNLRPGDLHGSGSDLQKFGDVVGKLGTELQKTGSKLSAHAGRDRSGVGGVLTKSLGRMTELAGGVFKEGGRVASAAGKRLHQSGTDHEHNERNSTDGFKKIHDGKGSDGPKVKSGGADGGTKSSGSSGNGSGHGHGNGGSTVDKPPEVGHGGKKDDSSVGGNNKNPSENGNSNNHSTATEDPIDLATGRVFLDQTDLNLAGVLQLVFARSHRSNLRCGRFFGPTWSSTVDQRIDVDETGVHYLGADGMLLSYPAPAPGAPVLPAEGRPWPLTADADGGYTIDNPDTGHTLHFPATAAGHPIAAISDRNGNSVEFTRAADGTPVQIGHAGRRITVDSAHGRITGLRLAGTEDIPLVGYRYDDLGRLVAVRNGSGSDITFEYDHAGRLTRWVDRNGMWYRYGYDHAGRCVQARGRDGGLDCDLEYADGLTRRINSLGARTEYLLNERLQIVRQTDALGGTEEMTWDANHRLLSHVDQLGRTTRYDYDDAGNLSIVTAANGGQTLTEYNAAGLPVSIVDADGSVRSYAYDERGNRIAETDPTGARTVLAYDERGALRAVTDPAGNTSTVEVDRAGLPVALIGAAGELTRYTRDALGRVTTITDHLGRATSLVWTVDGDLVERRVPDGTVQRWLHDGEGNEVESVSPTGAVHRTEIGHFDLPVAQVRVDGSRIEFDYDTEMRLTGVTEANGLRWTFQYDPLGNLVAETDLNGRTRAYRYDAAGQLVARTNGAGETVHYRHDALGNLVHKQVGDEVTTFERDELGRVRRAVNPVSDLRFDYDPLGRVIAETCNGRTVTSRYDATGRRTARSTPSGAHSAWEYDAAGRPVAMRTAAQSVEFGYDGAGNEVHRRIGAAVLQQSWDVNDRLETQVLGSASGVLQRRAYRYRPDGYLSDVVDQLSGGRALELDAVGRVTEVRGRSNEQYGYDPAGNVTTVEGPVRAPGRREYVGTLLRRAGNVSYDYDGQGRLVHRRHKRLSTKDDVWRYSWDADDRLTGVTTPDGTRWRYSYDAYGRRIAKQRLAADGSVAEQVDFVWDDGTLAEQLHRGHDGSARVTTWEYRPGGVCPVSQAERVPAANSPQEWIDARFYAIVTDLVGTPTELVDAEGNLAWHAESTLWGVLHTVGGDGAATPLRFPGQYFDAETGLNYNFQRYYDPETGRYASLDPLGMLPAPNPNTYVPNPTGEVDPLGLAPCKLGQLMKSWNTQQYRVNGKDYHLDNAGMRHILQRHHPDYWDGSVAQNQSFLHKNETPYSIDQKIREVLRQNPQGVRGQMGQLTGIIDGRQYVVGVNGDRIGQFYRI